MTVCGTASHFLFICVAALVANLLGFDSVDVKHWYNYNYILGSRAQKVSSTSNPLGWSFINDLHCQQWCGPACPFLILPRQFSWQRWWHQTYSSVALSPWREKKNGKISHCSWSTAASFNMQEQHHCLFWRVFCFFSLPCWSQVLLERPDLWD